MKAASTTRPARRIPAARLARMRAQATAAVEAREAAFQARQDALAQLVSPTPEYTAAPRLTMLPGGLHWSAQQVPAVGETVTVTRDGYTELAKVQGYCHAGGFLGLIAETTHHAKTSRRRAKATPRANCVFGYQLAKVA